MTTPHPPACKRCGIENAVNEYDCEYCSVCGDGDDAGGWMPDKEHHEEIA